MTWNAQPNRNDVLTSAKNNGYSVIGHHTIPNVWGIEKPTSSSDAVVEPTVNGTRISAGTTAGDTVSIETVQTYPLEFMDETRVTWTFDTTKAPSPPNDHLKIGLGMPQDPSKEDGVYLDVTNGEIHLLWKTFQMNWDVSNFRGVGVGIFMDRKANTTSIEVRSGNKSQVEQINSASLNNQPYGLHLVSNGNGDRVNLLSNSLTFNMDWQN